MSKQTLSWFLLAMVFLYSVEIPQALASPTTLRSACCCSGGDCQCLTNPESDCSLGVHNSQVASHTRENELSLISRSGCGTGTGPTALTHSLSKSYTVLLSQVISFITLSKFLPATSKQLFHSVLRSPPDKPPKQ